MSFAIGDTTAFAIKQGATTSTSADDVSHASAKEIGRGAGYHNG